MLHFVNKDLYNSIAITIFLRISITPYCSTRAEVKSKMMRSRIRLSTNKKAVVAQLLPVVTALVGIGITLVVGFLILSEVAANSMVSADVNASEAVDQVQEAMDDIPGWLPIIVVAIIGALLIGLVQLFRS